jgi:hypothetical protein
MEKEIHVSINYKKPEVARLMSIKVHFKRRSITKDKMVLSSKGTAIINV